MKSKVSIFNPLNKDVKVNWDLSGNPKSWVLKSKEITKIDSTYEKHAKRVLANAIFEVKGTSRKDRDIQMKAIYEEMRV